MATQRQVKEPGWAPIIVTVVVGVVLVLLNLIPQVRFNAMAYGFPVPFVFCFEGGSLAFIWPTFLVDLLVFAFLLLILCRAVVSGDSGESSP